MSVRIRKMVSICLNFKIYDERFAEMLNFKDSDHIDSTISMFEKVDHLKFWMFQLVISVVLPAPPAAEFVWLFRLGPRRSADTGVRRAAVALDRREPAAEGCAPPSTTGSFCHEIGDSGVDCIGLGILESQCISDFGIHKQTDLVEQWKIDCQSNVKIHAVATLWFWC